MSEVTIEDDNLLHNDSDIYIYVCVYVYMCVYTYVHIISIYIFEKYKLYVWKTICKLYFNKSDSKEKKNSIINFHGLLHYFILKIVMTLGFKLMCLCIPIVNVFKRDHSARKKFLLFSCTNFLPLFLPLLPLILTMSLNLARSVEMR